VEPGVEQNGGSKVPPEILHLELSELLLEN
jgi:hypothetical protein